MVSQLTSLRLTLLYMRISITLVLRKQKDLAEHTSHYRGTPFAFFFFNLIFILCWGIIDLLDDLKVTGEGNGKPLQYSCLENPMNSMKRPKDMTLKDELPRLIGAQYATGDQWSYNTRKNEEMEPK